MKSKVLIVFLLVLFSLGIHTISNAAIYSNDPTVNSGENITIYIKSNIAVSSYTVVANNECGFSLVSSSGGTGNGLTITGAAQTGDGITSLATYVFKAPTVAQDTTYKMTFSGTIMEDKDFNAIPDDSATATIKVKAPETPKPSENSNTSTNNQDDDLPTASSGGTTQTVKSSNNYLKSLKLSTGSINFNKKTTKYSLEVPEETENITITATAEHEKATVKGTGKVVLNKGNNTINVVVTAENGSARNYQLTVVRLGSEENEEEQEETAVVYALSSLKLKGVKDSGEIIDITITPEFSQDVFYYECEIPEGISFIDVEQQCDILDAIVEVTGNKDLVDGENLINIFIKYTDENEEEQTITYQIAATKKVTEMVAEVVIEEQGLSTLQIAIISGAVLVIIILIIILVVKHRKAQDDMDFGEYGEPFYSEDEDDIFEKPIGNLKVNEERENVEEEIIEDVKEQKEKTYEWDDFESEKKRNIFGKNAKKGKHF